MQNTFVYRKSHHYLRLLISRYKIFFFIRRPSSTIYHFDISSLCNNSVEETLKIGNTINYGFAFNAPKSVCKKKRARVTVRFWLSPSLLVCYLRFDFNKMIKFFCLLFSIVFVSPYELLLASIFFSKGVGNVVGYGMVYSVS